MRTVFRFITAPIRLVINILIWICSLFLKCSAGVLGLLGIITGALAILLFAAGYQESGWMMLALALLISPIGLPLITVFALRGLQWVSDMLA